MALLVTIVAVLAMIATVCVGYGVLVERRWYRLRYVRLAGGLSRNPGAAPPLPLRILHLSDLHVQPDDAKLARFLQAVARHDYDLVVLTGDLLGSFEVEAHCLELLAPVLAKAPGVLVLGSNDVFGPAPKSPVHYFTNPDHRVHGDLLATDELTTGLARLGVTTLHGGWTAIETRVGMVVVTGIEDPHLTDSGLPDVALLTPPPDLAPIVHLGLTHAPYVAALDLLLEAGCGLLLAGHTHGGQVRFPPIGAVVGNCDLPLRQIRGASRFREAWLHVSPGLGTSPYAPFRFACRPEATLLHVTL